MRSVPGRPGSRIEAGEDARGPRTWALIPEGWQRPGEALPRIAGQAWGAGRPSIAAFNVAPIAITLCKV